ncbi:flagellar motor switch phosphatase FliY [Gorillibacterium timonense]|uniref:flagellar motor switch phosphatase FliY n=1 Tax=Gorillibacterium timonense TaxID=1689269 RepID=UPI00071DCA54|nr:flagellar motor switch phosphatase FliY [Gorillibacterium timonense]
MTNNRDYLSQEEIDALLRQTSDDDEDANPAESSPDLSQYLSSIEQDALGEIGNITFGSAATALSTLLGKKVDITTPKVSILLRSQLPSEFPKPHVTVHVNYVDGFHGINLLVIKVQDAQVIADLMMGGNGEGLENTELNELHISAVQEAMNQMMGSSATSMSTIFNRMVNISPPGIDIMDLTSEGGKNTLPAEEVFVKISFRLKIGDLIDSNIMQLLPVDFSKEMVNTLMGGSDAMESEPGYTAPANSPSAPAATPQQDAPPAYPAPAAAQNPPQQIPQSYDATTAGGQAYPQQNPYYPPQPSPYGYPPYAGQPMGMPAPGPQNYGAPVNRNVNVQPAQFSGFTPGLIPPAEESNLGLLMDIPLKVTVELGRSKMLIKDILQLSQGSIIELDKLAGEPVDILVNNKLIAKGEVVVIDENFGVRVTDIINQWERIQKIQ